MNNPKISSQKGNEWRNFNILSSGYGTSDTYILVRGACFLGGVGKLPIPHYNIFEVVVFLGKQDYDFL